MSKDPDTSVVNETWLRELSCAGAVMDQLAQGIGFLVQCCTVLNWHLHLHIVRITLVLASPGKTVFRTAQANVSQRYRHLGNCHLHGVACVGSQRKEILFLVMVCWCWIKGLFPVRFHYMNNSQKSNHRSSASHNDRYVRPESLRILFQNMPCCVRFGGPCRLWKPQLTRRCLKLLDSHP